MAETTTEVAKDVTKPAFNAEDFAGTKKEKVGDKENEEPIDPKKEAPIEGEIEIQFDETKTEDGKPTTVVGKAILDRFKELDPELKDEEEVLNKYKSFKEENDKLRIVSKGRDLIDNDEDIKGWKKATTMSDTEKAETALYLTYVKKGFGQEEAADKAKKKIAEYEESDIEKIREEAVEFTSWLNRSIEGKTKHIEEEILKNTVKLDVDDNVITKSSPLIMNTTHFLGMSLPKDAEARAKVLKQADEFDLNSALKDPQAVAEIKMYLKHKDAYTKSIAQRSSSKQDVIEKLDKAPAVNVHKVMRGTDAGKDKGFSPYKF